MTAKPRRRRLVRGVGALALASVAVATPARATPPSEAVAEADWILSLQISDGPHAGMIPLSELRTSCVPYFANMAASGLASATFATGDSRYAGAAWEWLDWYAAHMDANGFVTDYENVDGVWASTGAYDSTDAYAATFISAVRDVWAVTGDDAKLNVLWPAVQGAVDAILATATPGWLTYAKPGWPLKYLMDNVEVYQAWQALAEMAGARGDGVLSGLAAEWLAGMPGALDAYWSESLGGYAVAIDSSGVADPVDWAEFYPSTTAQVWMINSGLVPAARAAMLADRIELEHPAWDDPDALDLFDTEEGRFMRPITWWPEFADAFTTAGRQARGIAGLTAMRDAAVAAGRAWPYHAGNAGRIVEFVVARPDTWITGGPPAFASSTSAVFTFAGTVSAVSYECALDGAAFAVCDNPASFEALAEGAHELRARALDAAGHADPYPASHQWTVDTTPPSVALTETPPNPSNIVNTAFAFTGADALSPSLLFECAVDGSAFAACTSPSAYPSIGTGLHTFRVRARDAAGNLSTEGLHAWAADTVAPSTTITGGPSGLVSSPEVEVTFEGSDDAPEPVAYECRLGGASWAECASPATVATAAEARYLFEVRARDGAGNPDPTPATRSWFVDRTPPDTGISSAPSGVAASTSARFVFSGSDNVSPSWEISYECSVDGRSFRLCTSPHTATGLADGPHVFEVRARDGAGLADPTPARVEWSTDMAPPVSRIDTRDGWVLADLPPTLERSVAGTVTDAGAGVQRVTAVFATIAGNTFSVPALLDCEDATRRACVWRAPAPAPSGRYRVRIEATDFAGSVETPGPPGIWVHVL